MAHGGAGGIREERHCFEAGCLKVRLQNSRDRAFWESRNWEAENSEGRYREEASFLRIPLGGKSLVHTAFRTVLSKILTRGPTDVLETCENSFPIRRSHN